MILKETAYAKLNLALHVRGKLPDGRHRLETVFAFCEDGDLLEAEPADRIELRVAGPFVDGLSAGSENLVVQAAQELRAASGASAGALLRLDKKLPVASGIGGGSADAAAVLRLLSKLWSLDPTVATAVAPGLGSDVPACLASRDSFGREAGDLLEPMELGLAGTPVLLVNPRLPLPTGAVFEAWDGVDRGPLNDWREGRNDLELPATELVPQVGDVLNWLRGRAGADVARMSGSGATCFALFAETASRDAAAKAVPASWWNLATRLR